MENANSDDAVERMLDQLETLVKKQHAAHTRNPADPPGDANAPLYAEAPNQRPRQHPALPSHDRRPPDPTDHRRVHDLRGLRDEREAPATEALEHGADNPDATNIEVDAYNPDNTVPEMDAYDPDPTPQKMDAYDPYATSVSPEPVPIVSPPVLEPRYGLAPEPEARAEEPVQPPLDPAAEQSAVMESEVGRDETTPPEIHAFDPDATAPEADAFDPDATAPEMDAFDPDATAPEMDASDPDATAPEMDASDPDATAPEMDASDQNEMSVSPEPVPMVPPSVLEPRSPLAPESEAATEEAAPEPEVAVAGPVSPEVPAELPQHLEGAKMMRRLTARLGQLLVDANLLSESQLNSALERQQETGERLGAVVVNQGYIDEPTLLSVLESQYGVPSVDLDDAEIDPALAKLMPRDMAERYLLVPLALRGDAIDVAMVDPTDFVAMAHVRFATGLRPNVFIATITAVQRAIARAYAEQHSAAGGRPPDRREAVKRMILDRDSMLIAADQDPRKFYELAASIDAFVDEIFRKTSGSE